MASGRVEAHTVYLLLTNTCLINTSPINNKSPSPWEGIYPLPFPSPGPWLGGVLASWNPVSDPRNSKKHTFLLGFSSFSHFEPTSQARYANIAVTSHLIASKC